MSGLHTSSEHVIAPQVSTEVDQSAPHLPLLDFSSFPADSRESSVLKEAARPHEDHDKPCSSQHQEEKLLPKPPERHGSMPNQHGPTEAGDGNTDERRDSHTAQFWNSLWLHWLTLLAFLSAFASLLIGLILLWHFASIENGIQTNITKNHYAWTYGPTALLVVLAVAWGQVDFYCRTLTPWSHLRHGPVSAKKSLLLDYVSPTLPTMLFVAAAKHDWAVVASGAGVLLLRLVIVFSTGLLVLTPTAISEVIPKVAVNTTFSATDYGGVPTAIETEVMRYFDIRKRGGTYQYGAAQRVAYETIDLRSAIPNSTISATVHGIFPFFECEILTPELRDGSLTWKPSQYGEEELDLTLTLNPSRCGPLSASSTPCMLPNCPEGRTIVTNDAWRSSDTSAHEDWNDPNPCLHFYQLAVADVYTEKLVGHADNTSAGWNVTLKDSVGLFCAAGYSVDTLRLKIHTSDPMSAGGISTSGPVRRVADVLPNFPYGDLTNALANELLVTGLPSLKKDPNTYITSGFPLLLGNLNGGSAVALLNATVLKNAAEDAFKGIVVQLVHNYLRKPVTTTIAAEASYQQQRLQTRILCVWAMGVGFVLLASCTGAILLWRPKDVVPRDPNSVARQASILAASPQLRTSLALAGDLAPSMAAERLGGIEATSHSMIKHGLPQFCIEAYVIGMGKERLPTPHNELSWWHPRPASLWYICITIILPLAVIVLLQVLQHESNEHAGLVSVISTSTLLHALPSIFASAVMVSIAALYDAAYFVAATLAPFQLLARAETAATATALTGTCWGHLPIWSTIKAIRGHYSGTAVASVAAFISSLLTIIASGLYAFETVPYGPNVKVNASDKFVPTFGILTDGSAGYNFQSIEQNNGSYPSLTHDGLAFPNLDLSTLTGFRDHITLQARVKAMRASLRCTMVPHDIMETTTYAPGYSDGCRNTGVKFNASLPASCPQFLNADNQTISAIPFEYYLQLSCPGSSTLSVHHQAVLNMQRYMDNYDLDLTFFAGSSLGAPQNPAECPSLAFLSGHFVENTTSASHFTAMTCIQGLEEVDALITFTASTGSSIQIKSPPIVDERSARWLHPFNSVYWFTQENFAALRQPHISYAGVENDNFYSQVNYGPDGILPSELTGPLHAQRFVNATQRLYRRYMAQLISGTMRVKLNNTETVSAPAYSGVLLGMSHQRLQQNATSKFILQILLAIMLVCGAYVYAKHNMKHVVPMCPWSIAGTMSLLAGSQMLDRNVIPAGAECLSDTQLVKGFGDRTFRLGWWDAAGGEVAKPGPGRRFGIDMRKTDDDARS